MIISQNLESFLIKEILREGNFLWALASEWAADFLIVTAQNGQKMGFCRGALASGPSKKLKNFYRDGQLVKKCRPFILATCELAGS
jgi:hypothetical protein